MLHYPSFSPQKREKEKIRNQKIRKKKRGLQTSWSMAGVEAQQVYDALTAHTIIDAAGTMSLLVLLVAKTWYLQNQKRKK